MALGEEHGLVMARMQFFFDESGKSNLHSAEKSDQHNLIIAGILVDWESGFWDQVKSAWECAADLLKMQPENVELHGWELYGGKGQWTDAPNALPVLETIFSALENHKVPIYWVGLPIQSLNVIKDKKWHNVLVHFLNLLHEELSLQKPLEIIEAYGDENEWVQECHALTMDHWELYENKQVGFLRSQDIHGIQIADVVAHTIYRSNKPNLSNTDKTANEFRSRVASQIHFVSSSDA